MAQRPLEGVRILAFSWVLIGPQTVEYLISMGAEGIKVESNAFPELMRRGRPFADDQIGLNRAGGFNAVNRGCKSITLSLDKPEGAELARELIRKWQPDIITENFTFGTMERRGLGYEDIRQIKPDIIYCSMSMLGNTGPYAWHRGYGGTLQSRTGMSALSGYREDQIPSSLSSTYYPDIAMAPITTYAIAMALWHRHQTGEGQYLDFAQNEGVIQTLADAMMDYTMNGRVQTMRGNRDPLYAPQGTYRCSGDDKWVAISVANDGEWQVFCQATRHPQWAQDPRFGDALSRQRNHDELDVLITEWTKQHTNYEVMDILQKAGVAAAPAVDAEQFVFDPHLRDRGFFMEVDHDEIGVRLYGGWPVHLSEVEPKVGKAPLLGQHNEEVFGGILGLSEGEIQRLVAEQVIY